MPPRTPRRWLPRSRLNDLLAHAAEHTLTIVQASAGYGKSSALAWFAQHGGWPSIWLSLTEGLDEPGLFLRHLAHACRAVAPHVGTQTLDLLDGAAQEQLNSLHALNALLNDLVAALDDETLLILDDYHSVAVQPDVRALVERLIVGRPPLLHLVLATRRWPELDNLPALQARGELFVVSDSDLAFTAAEIATLFEATCDTAVGPEAAQRVREHTEGWPIAVQLLAHTGVPVPPGDVQPGRASQFDANTAMPDDTRTILFRFLAHDVLSRQPAHVQEFLLRSSLLAEIEPTACEQILELSDSDTLLADTYRSGLFLTRLSPDLYRYHALFQTFLQQQAREQLGSTWEVLHQRAAAYYRARGVGERVLYHVAASEDNSALATELERYAPSWLAAGRHATLLTWIDRLPQVILPSQPGLLLARGDAARALDQFDIALAAYQAAEQFFDQRRDSVGRARALQGQAMVYLDTVQPAQGGDLLQRAFRSLPAAACEQRAGIMRLIAENRLNQGRADQAARLFSTAVRISQHESTAGHAFAARVALRRGRLDEAQALLENQYNPGAGHADERWSPAHREAFVLFSLVCALQGQGVRALRSAQAALSRAEERGSLLLAAIAHIRLGHAYQLVEHTDPAAANHHYLQAMTLADNIRVSRTKAEAYLGLCLLHGFGGDDIAAQAAATEGRAIASRSGDAWMEALLLAGSGSVATLRRDAAGVALLQQALAHFRRCKDTYGQALVQLWLSLWHHGQGEQDLAAAYALDTLTLCKQHSYVGLLTRPTLFGPRDRMMLVPLLLAGRSNGSLSSFAKQCLAHSFPAIANDEATENYHPGTTLRIQTLGPLRVWRGLDEVAARDWQRKKAPELLALLVTNRHRWLQRDQICDALWPDESGPEGESQFKVTLNALNGALEPRRPPRTTPFYIRRRGGAYRFVALDGLWVDVDEFVRRVRDAQRNIAENDMDAAQADLGVALGLYADDYLADWLHAEWSQDERGRLVTTYLEAGSTLAELLLRRDQLAEVVQVCERILARDSCWEAAYTLMMQAYARMGHRRQAIATYERCVRQLRSRLDMAPLPATTRLYEELKA